MPVISMTTFVDFALANGLRRLTVVRDAKARYERGYHPAEDFYKPLRDGIVDAACQNLDSQKTLASIHSTLGNVDARRSKPYQECIAGYKKWRGRKQLLWDEALTSERSEWKQGRLVVRINPELGVLIDGSLHIIKLYFKSAKPSQLRLQAMLYLLQQYACKEHGHVNVGILDVRRGRLYTPTRDVPDIKTFLAAEAAAFQTMWH